MSLEKEIVSQQLEELKLFLRVDGTDEDDLIQALQTSAEEYLTNSGVNKDYDKGLYKLAIKLLVGHWYENRSVETIGKNISKIAFSLDAIIFQLKHTQNEV